MIFLTLNSNFWAIVILARVTNIRQFESIITRLLISALSRYLYKLSFIFVYSFSLARSLSYVLYASINKVSLLFTSSLSIRNFFFLVTISYFTYSELLYLKMIYTIYFDWFRLLHSLLKLFNPSKNLNEVFTVLLLQFFERKNVQPCCHMVIQVIFTNNKTLK